MITQAYLHECLLYDADTGEFTWKRRPESHFTKKRYLNIWNARYAWKPAGCIVDGYRVICLDRRLYRAHRLAFLYVNGRFPSDQIDHANMDRADNRLVNIREASRSQNGANRGDVGASSGVKGVSWHRHTGRWQVRIGVRGRSIYLGVFDDLDEAKDAYRRAAEEHFGEFARAA